jgi:uncharacterized protein YodC (DUF2158 family)
MADFTAGDTVRLKSGGPAMTGGSKTSSGSVECHWFNQNGSEYTHKFHTFEPDLLRLVDMGR